MPPAAPRQESASDGSPAQRSAEATAGPRPSLGTGHGRREWSPVERVAFERASDEPDQRIVIRYDRRENLVAMGILPPPVIAGTPNPFPSWTPRFTPDPPR